MRSMAGRWRASYSQSESYVVSESRQCIRDVLSDFRQIENKMLLNKSMNSFELYVQQSGIGKSSSFSPAIPSCGNTVQCLASLFLNASQINQSFLYEVLV